MKRLPFRQAPMLEPLPPQYLYQQSGYFGAPLQSMSDLGWRLLRTTRSSMQVALLLQKDRIDVLPYWEHAGKECVIFWRSKRQLRRNRTKPTTTGESKSLGDSLGSPDASKDADNGGDTGEPASEDCRYKNRRWWAG